MKNLYFVSILTALLKFEYKNLALAQSLGCYFASQLDLAASRLVVLSVECTDSRELSKF